jgi:hypothetical protein
MFVRPAKDGHDTLVPWARSHVPGFWRLTTLTEEIERKMGGSPLEVFFEGKFRLLKNDVILPNGYANEVVKAALRNGDRILFYSEELQTYERIWAIATDYWVQLAKDLKRTNYELVVVLVPNKYTVYHRVLSTKPAVGIEPGELLSRIEKELNSKGVPVVNLTTVLQSDAERNADRRIYNYYREDTHWNPRGMQLAAEEINRTVPELRAACR